MSMRNDRELALSQNALCNTIGTLVYYICQWILSLAVVRLSSASNVGHFQLAMTVSNVFTAVANYNMRTFQISDLQEEYRSSHYVASRLITCGIAFTGCILYSLAWGYSGISLTCVVLYMLYRLSESFSDVLHGIDQRHSRMDHVMVSYVLRGVLMTGAMILLLKAAESLIPALCGLIAVTWAVVLLYDLRVSGRYDSVRPLFEFAHLGRLLLTCLPGVLSAVCFSAIVSIPRQHLAELRGQELLGFYATVATPLVFVQVLLNSLMNPLLSGIALAWQQRNRKVFLRINLRLLLIILFAGAVALGGIHLLGEPVMTLLYGEVIRPYVNLMPAVTGCAVMYAVCCVTFNLLVIARKMKTLLLVSTGALLISVFSGRFWIQALAADGTSICIMISYLAFALVSFILVVREMKHQFC